MRVLRVLLTGLIAIVVVVGGLLAAATLVLAQLFRGKSGSAQAGRPAASRHPTAAGRNDVIDIEATPIPNDPPVR